MSQQKTIALDVMSGDRSPRFRIAAALDCLSIHPGLHFILVGDRHFIRDSLTGSATELRSRITVVHADQVVTMDDRPSLALRRKQNSSMWRALEQVSMGVAQACVSAGNTGALMAMGRFLLKTHPGIDRPAIIGQIPSIGRDTFMLDLGANVDCNSEHLYQFAVLGSLMLSEVIGITAPTIGLLNVGQEDIKGDERVRLAQELILANPGLNYQGFVEGHDIFRGTVDLVVCDGFPGNVALKAGEGASSYISHVMRQGTGLTGWRKLYSYLALPFVRHMVRQIDPSRFNGASFLGLQGVVVKSHGGADQREFGYALERAVMEVERNAIYRINDKLESYF
ncbi:phosphate acyltransferase PlsX [Kistimonas scapharcae]|uniref:Phosphate acyltransferase n=1 Tax=Kistimonas scapharcae TaxID=1036133 RepID=A0ABP8V941_9GAMM